MITTGKKSGPLCRTCRHPRVAEINAARDAGVPVKEIRATFSTEEDLLPNERALYLHFRNCQRHLASDEPPEPPPEDAPSFEAEDAATDGALRMLYAHLREVERGISKADRKQEGAQYRALLEQRRKTLSDIADAKRKAHARMDEARREQGALTLTSERWLTIRRVLSEALEPYPEARGVVAEALSELGGITP